MLKDWVSQDPQMFQQSSGNESVRSNFSGNKSTKKGNKEWTQDLIKKTSNILDEVMNAKSK